MIHVSINTTQPKLVVYSQRHITLLLPTNIHFQKIFEYRTAHFARQVEFKLLTWTKKKFNLRCRFLFPFSRWMAVVPFNLDIFAITQFMVFLVISFGSNLVWITCIGQKTHTKLRLRVGKFTQKYPLFPNDYSFPKSFYLHSSVLS